MGTFRERFWELICGVSLILYPLMILLITLLLLSFFSVAVLGRSHSEFILVVINITYLSAALVIVVYLLIKCRDRHAVADSR